VVFVTVTPTSFEASLAVINAQGLSFCGTSVGVGRVAPAWTPEGRMVVAVEDLDPELEHAASANAHKAANADNADFDTVPLFPHLDKPDSAQE
jgi:hypothetical protein